MNTIKFKTNLKCDGCINTIKSVMNTITGIELWTVFIDDKDKTLEVNFEDSDEKEIINAVQSAITKSGYEIEKL
ncbi:MAG: cation transporter [Bacteroidales bacterium]|nr:cation transporter [Bacteroidales bacterium]